MILPLLGLIAGLGLLYSGAEAIVREGSRLAGSLGVSSLVIGLTVVAFRPSFPELCVSVIGAARAQSDVAAGNVVLQRVPDRRADENAGRAHHPELRREARARPGLGASIRP